MCLVGLCLITLVIYLLLSTVSRSHKINHHLFFVCACAHTRTHNTHHACAMHAYIHTHVDATYTFTNTHHTHIINTHTQTTHTRSVMEHWLKDEAVDNCMQCNVEFTFTERKRHCRDWENILCKVSMQLVRMVRYC